MRLKGEPCLIKWCCALVEKNGDTWCKVHQKTPSFVPRSLSVDVNTTYPGDK